MSRPRAAARRCRRRAHQCRHCRHIVVSFLCRLTTGRRERAGLFRRACHPAFRRVRQCPTLLLPAAPPRRVARPLAVRRQRQRARPGSPEGAPLSRPKAQRRTRACRQEQPLAPSPPPLARPIRAWPGSLRCRRRRRNACCACRRACRRRACPPAAGEISGTTGVQPKISVCTCQGLWMG